MDFKKIVKAAREQEWKVERTQKGHWRLIPPDSSKQIVVFGGTPSDQRAIKNGLAVMKRQGFIWSWPPK